MSAVTVSPPLRAAAVRDPEAATGHVLVVEFVCRDGRSWNAIGGGSTVEAAIATAHESCPEGAAWHVSGWKDLYGD